MSDQKTQNVLCHQKKHSNMSENTLDLKPSTDEIDLIDLLAIFFKNKVKIFFITIFFVIVSALICYKLPEKWTSKAIITYIDDNQLQPFELLSYKLKLFDISLNFDQKNLLSLFIQLFNSNVLKEKYLVNTSYFQKLIKDHPENRNQFMLDIIKNIHIEYSKSNKENDFKGYVFYTLSYSADTAKDAQNLLNGYINYISAIFDEKLNNKITNKINIKKSVHSFIIDNKGMSINDDVNLPMAKLQLEKLQSIKLSDIKIIPFEYLQKPNEHVKKDSPQSAFIILLSGMAGLMVSMFYVLVQHYLSQRNKP
ncbi:O-antigen chain length regulator [Candidatus Hamiltonella defensa]|uniref:O-antigen chain length regulator n=1 Tax=Candidatus Williamhamiltonella defendens TaxID=138072 RepID=A0AAC9VIX8_9ENTR|nr:Wzz/FepE/Etk N-terminal domain-containing protein [Candidatus Hamiltonella defensa]ASV33723.1 O-antigen chain length regulator [Candidatus Hamiltonella defensa]AWK16676.1 O-antigen chain length regulator [Candidatus Hamiltonella defensa]MBK4360762.1 O-antigen chain length regulator [Candidatus Hamiltonella defensa]